MLMGSATIGEARALKICLVLYDEGSGKKINRTKSSLYFFNTHEHRQRKIANILGCGVNSLPSTYLGLPLGSKTLDSFWISLVDRFNRKLSGWKGALLSQAGKVLLLKASLKNFPIYALSLFKIPTKFVDIIKRIQKWFLWSRVEEKKRISLVAWERVCRPKKSGGLGLRNIRVFNKALLAKQVWRTFAYIQEWNSIWHNKYLREVESLQDFLNSQNIPSSSFLWNNTIKARDLASKEALWKVGDGKKFSFGKTSGLARSVCAIIRSIVFIWKTASPGLVGWLGIIGGMINGLRSVLSVKIFNLYRFFLIQLRSALKGGRTL